MNLAQLKSGESGKIVLINICGDSAIKICQMGFTTGTVVKIIKKAPFGDPIEIEIRGYRVCLRASECKKIIVAQLKEDVYYNNQNLLKAIGDIRKKEQELVESQAVAEEVVEEVACAVIDKTKTQKVAKKAVAKNSCESEKNKESDQKSALKENSNKTKTQDSSQKVGRKRREA